MIKKNKLFALKFTLALITILAAHQQTFADRVGSINGSVIDRRTSEALPGANITIAGTMRGAASDSEGKYAIPKVPEGNYRIIASMIGYKTVTKTVEVSGDENVVLDFSLYPTVIPMSDVIVTATKTENFLGDIPVSANVITREEIELANIETASQAVKYIPGVYAQGGYGWVKEAPKLQGLDPQYTLLLLDGQKIRGAPKYSADLSQYPAEMIERVEIIKGPASSLYGSDAVSGVINVVTRTAPEKPTGSASAAFGTYNTRIYKLSQGAKLGGFGYFLSYNHRESDGVVDTLDRFKDDGFQASLGYEFSPDLKIVLRPGYFQREQELDPMIPEQKRYSLNGLCQWRINETSKLKLRASWFDYERVMFRGGLEDEKKDIEHEMYEAELNYNLLFLKNLFTLGYHYCEEYHTHFKFDPEQKSGTESQLTNSFFVQDEVDLNPFTLMLGTRIDNHDKWGTVVNPNAGLLYRLTDDLKLRGSVGRAFKEPPMCHLYTVDLFRSTHWIRANPDLKPEKSWGYQIGAEYEIGDDFTTKVAFFRNDIEDMIEQYDTGEDSIGAGFIYYPIYSYKNIDEVYTQGAEFVLQQQFSDWESARLGYTWLESRDKTTDEELYYNPKHKFNLEVEIKINRYDLGINLRNEYIGERWGYYIEPGLCPGMAGPPEPEQLESYYLAHVKVSKTFNLFSFLKKQVKAQIFVSVNNIFDEKYYEWGIREMPGREFLGGMKFKF